MFGLGHYPFFEARRFPQTFVALLSQNCSLLGTENVREQISVHISRHANKRLLIRHRFFFLAF